MSITKHSDHDFHFSGHETFTLRHLWLKKVCDFADSNFMLDKHIFSDDFAISRFGVGKNMVSSIKHWALACGIIDEFESKSHFKLSELGKLIFLENGLDPYVENIATAWLIHWQLAGLRPITENNKHRSSTWYLLFNSYILPEFSIKDIVEHIKQHIESFGKHIAEKSLKNDVETCIKGYAPRSLSETTEDISEPLLAELELIKSNKNGKYFFVRGQKPSLPNCIFDYALLDYWSMTIKREKTLSLNDITFGIGSPGRVFKLDEDSIVERLYDIAERTDGTFTWSSSSGVQQIVLTKNINSLFDLKIERLRTSFL